MLDLDIPRINSFAIEWLRCFPDEDMHAGVLVTCSRYLTYTKWLQRDYDRRYVLPKILRCDRCSSLWKPYKRIRRRFVP